MEPNDSGSFDLEGLTPEDLKALMAQIGSMSSAPADGSDDRMSKLCEAVEFLINEVETLGKRVDDLHTLVVKDLFGSINDQYQQNVRTQGIDSLKGKYGELLAPHMPAIQALDPNADVFDQLYDLVNKARGENPEMDDEGADGLVKSSIQGLADKLAAIRGAAPAEAEKPAETEVIAEGEPKPEGKENPAKNRVNEVLRASALKMIR